MRIIIGTFTSMDGVVQAPGTPDEDPSGGFEHGGWQHPFADQELYDWAAEELTSADGFLLGRKTYEIFAAHWPKMPDADDPIAGVLNQRPKFVVSTTITPEQATWAETTILRSTDDVAALKAQGDGDLMVQGSTELVRSLAAHDLVDEYHLWIYPLVLGRGKRIFDEGAAARSFELIDARPTTKGAVLARYRRAGGVQHGSFAQPDD
jgi:dihydrofolate reductase